MRAVGVQTYSVSEAARLLGISSKALQARARRGAISSQKVGGRWEIAFDPADLPELRKEHGTK